MKRQQSSSIVFLTELFLSLTIFALCSSVCAGLFAWSYRYSKDSNALSRAVMAAQSCAEAFKRNDSAQSLAEALGGTAGAGSCLVYYDEDWTPTTADQASFILRVSMNLDTGIRLADIVVSNAEDAEIFKLAASALLTEVRP
ncbi:MAG: hypothetical protein FWG28_02130 [Clostridiales bacterium]|nr:hypothetical protein [Clostridiales bacterium]